MSDQDTGLTRDHVESLRVALANASHVVIRVPWESPEDRDDLRSTVEPFTRSNGGPMLRVEHGAHDQRDVTPPDCPYTVVEMHDTFLDFVFPGDVDVDTFLAFAELVAPFAWPDRPTLRTVPKGSEA